MYKRACILGLGADVSVGASLWLEPDETKAIEIVVEAAAHENPSVGIQGDAAERPGCADPRIQSERRGECSIERPVSIQSGDTLTGNAIHARECAGEQNLSVRLHDDL